MSSGLPEGQKDSNSVTVLTDAMVASDDLELVRPDLAAVRQTVLLTHFASDDLLELVRPDP